MVCLCRDTVKCKICINQITETAGMFVSVCQCIGSGCIVSRLKKIQWFLGYCILFRLRNTLIIDNSDNTIRTQYTVDNFSAATNVQQMLLFYSSHLYGLFFFDHISFGFVVVFIYKTVKHKIAQVNTPLHLIWQYSISMVN